MTSELENVDKTIYKMELLAPAGGFEALKAAVENGADAVYLGGKLFNARASAANFDDDELRKAIAYAHERQVKIYVTVNILVSDREFPELADYLYRLYSMGVDAVIVQDIGVAHFIRKVLPEIELHASTQMTQTNSWGLKQLEKMGFSRVVLARETSKAEMTKMTAGTKMDVEVFVHGALCISYSGQCLMSSYIGARSGNRGKCAQPCRLTYQLVDEKGKELFAESKIGEHLLSPKDLNLSENLAELQEVGVSSLKVEGRMKRPEYVATVIRIYRKVLDSLTIERPNSLDDQDRYELLQIFNRDFTTGYLHTYQGADMMSYSRPNNRGTRAGRILEVKSNRLTLKLENVLNLGDGLEIWTSRGREGITAGKIFDASGRAISKASAGEKVTIEFSGSAKVGDRVFKTFDQELMERARISFQEGREQRKRSLRMKLSGKSGSKLLLEAWENDEHRATAESETAAQVASNRPLEREFLTKQLGRLGNTPFYLEELIVDLQGDIIIPVRELNELRRIVVERLLKPAATRPVLDQTIYRERLRIWQKEIKGREENRQAQRQGHVVKKSIAKPILSAAITDEKLITPLLKAGADRIILGGERWRSRSPITTLQLQEIVDACSAKGTELVWRLPRILNEAQSLRVFKELTEIARWKTRPVMMMGNLAEIEMIKTLDPAWDWETDHFFHVFNREALHWVLEAGGKRAALSTELNAEQIRLFNSPAHTELIVFGDMEMMVSEYCAIGATLAQGKGSPREKCGKACEARNYFLKDRLAYHFPLETDRDCRMHIFNAKRLNLVTDLPKIAELGVSNIRLELHRASLMQAQKTAGIFKSLWTQAVQGRGIDPKKTEEAVKDLDGLYPEGFTKGHFYRGVLS